ncbi:ATP-binding cassette domain-containing protein [candidate division GN15 bacterium]|nr:ATP-binding cassette domain-containing protein [candidate division GN15 bacterium]
MTLLAAENLSKAYKDQVLLETVSFTITADDRIGLVGKNGIGKTTLLEILAGKEGTDSGQVTMARACRIDYIEQEKTDYLEASLFDFVAGARQDLLDQYREMRDLEDYLAANPNDRSAIERLGHLSEVFEAGGGFDFENEVKTILTGLGFEQERFRQQVRSFSGGEKNRAGLARLLAGNGTLLLLDEPTNHLDIESTAWLEDYLQKLGKAYVIVSHDRAFLTATVNTVWEMVFGKLERYAGGFERYLKERHDRRRLAEHHYKHQQQEIARAEEFIRRNMAGQKTKQAQSKLKYLNRLKRLPPPKGDERGPTITVASSGRSFAHVLSMEDVALGYGSRTVVEGVALDIYRGEKVAMVGRNGSGKSTVLKAMIGELDPLSGSIKLGSNVDVAYFDQDLSDLDPAETVIDSVWNLDPVAEAYTIRSFLARFGFTGEEVFKMVASLSGGEKTKLSLARLLYRPANFIILDEPTNHLDIDAREALEKALIEYDGSLLVVSHDRYFLSKVANRIAHVTNGFVNIYNGDYAYFRNKIESAEAPTETVKEKPGKQAYLEFKEASKKRSRHKKKIESTRELLRQKEQELAATEKAIAETIPGDDWEQLQEANHRKAQLEDDILHLYSELEELEATYDD